MVTIVSVFFWISLLLLIHGYILFPKSTTYIGRFLKRSLKRDYSFEPKVTLFIPAYNEESVIEKKILNSLSLDYPKDKFEIMICSDCSIDSTADIVNSWAENNEIITFFDYRERGGKTGLINRSIPKAAGDIVVLTDANTMIDKKAIKKLVSSFSSPITGAVLGQVQLYVPIGGKGLSKEVNYRQFETEIKFVEGLFGAAMGAFGGLYAIRKNLFRKLPSNTIVDDFQIPVRMISEGYSVVLDREAISFEETGNDISEEFDRRVRIGAGNFQIFFSFFSLFSPFKIKQFYFYFSHKLIRWFSPFILLVLFISSGALIIDSNFYGLIFIGQIFFYLVALIGWVGSRKGREIPVANSFYHFTAMNLALVCGFFRFCRGITSSAWESTARRV